MSYTENAIKMMRTSAPTEHTDQPCTNTIIFELQKQFIRRVDKEIIAAGSKNYLKAKFETPLDDWCKPITAIFDSYTVLLDDNNECFIPWEALSAPHNMAVSAFAADLHTAIVTLVAVEPSGHIPGQTPEPPTPDVYAQLAAMVQTAVNEAREEGRKAEAAATDAEISKNNAESAAETATDQAAAAASSAAAAKISETNAEGSEVSAAASAYTASSKAAEAEIAANAATDQASDAASSAAAAKASETSAAGSADSAAQSAKKAEDAAKSVPLIDDTTVSPDHPWSSQKIAETFCPPFNVSGPVVSCNPLVNSPLHVVSQIVPVQEGTGDPSPENVRPITGWTEANLWHGGKNLISGLKKGYYGTDFKLYEPTSTVYVSFSEQLPAGKYAISYSKNVSLIRYFTAKNNKTATTSILETDPINTKLAIINLKENDILYISFRLYSNDPWDGTVQMEYGNKTSPYEPYKGHVVTLEFGQTVYGGTLDWNTGVLTIDHFGRTYTHLDIFYSYSSNGVFSFATNLLDFKGKLNPITTKWMCDTLIPESYNYADANKKNYSVGTNSGSSTLYFRLDNNQEATVEDFKTWIGQHPTTVVADLRTPFSIQLTPTEILALSGVNTLYTDTGDTTVSGLADPLQVIQKLTERIAALESAATNI